MWKLTLLSIIEKEDHCTDLYIYLIQNNIMKMKVSERTSEWVSLSLRSWTVSSSGVAGIWLMLITRTVLVPRGKHATLHGTVALSLPCPQTQLVDKTWLYVDVLQTLGDAAVLVLGYSYFWTTQTFTIEHNVHFVYLILCSSYIQHIKSKQRILNTPNLYE